MTLHNLVKRKLEANLGFRERSLRNKYLAVLTLRLTGIKKDAQMEDTLFELGSLCHEQLADYAITFDSLRHAWTDCTRDYPELQGSDYNQKQVLVQNHQLLMGYQPMHYQVKQQVLLK